MTMIWNPAPHMQHAWTDAKTVWGKIALVLFYSLIWYAILSSAWYVIHPKSEQCIINDAVQHNESKAVLKAISRAANVMTIGFFSYADVGGMKLKNVAMVAIFTTASALMFWPVTKMKQAGGCSFDLAHLWLFPAVAITSLIFKLVDEKLADRGTPEETRSLVV